MKLNPADKRELQKREGPRGDRMRSIKWKNLEGQIGQDGQLLEMPQLLDHDRWAAVAPQQERLIQNDRQMEGVFAGEHRLARQARLHPGVHATRGNDLRRVRALLDR